MLGGITMTRLRAMLEQFMGTRIVAPLAVGVRGANVTHFDCHCGSDDCTDCYDCHCGSDDCTDCYDCHCGSDDCSSDCIGPSN